MAAYDEQDIPLKGPLDVSKLREGLDQEFELDADHIDEYGFEEDVEEGTPGYVCYEKDFCSEEDEAEDRPLDGDVMEFDRIAKKMTNVTPDGGVKKQIVVQGFGDVIPCDSFVRVHFNAYLECADVPFDSTYMQQRPFGFCLGSGATVIGFDEAVGTMRKGEKSRFLVGPNHAYGPLGCPPRIPANATILYVIEVLSFSESGSIEALLHGRSKQEIRELPFDTIQKFVEFKRKEAQKLFKDKRYKHAGRLYQQAINLLNDYHLQNEEEELQHQKILKELCLNLAVVNLTLSRFKPTIKCCNDALRIDRTDGKAFFLKAKALRKLGHFDEAKCALDQAARLRKPNKEFAIEYKALEDQQRRYNNLERSMCQRMFGNSTAGKSSSAANNQSVLGQVPQEFKDLIMSKLNVFKSDPETTEFPFSTSVSLSLTELRAIAELARSVGLYTTQERTQNGVTFFRVCKEDPSGK